MAFRPLAAVERRNASIRPWSATKLPKWIGAIGVLLLFVALRWSSIDAPLMRDEGEFAYAARLLNNGGLPYRDSFLQKPPMGIYYYALADWIAPNVFWFPRILAWAVVGISTYLLARTAQREFGGHVGLAVAWIMTPMVLLPGSGEAYAMTEDFMLLPLLIVVFLYIKDKENPHPAYWILAGAVNLLTLLHKYTAFPLVVAVFSAWFFQKRMTGVPVSSILRLALCALSGALIAAAAALFIFIISDGCAHFYECTVEFNRCYAASTNFGPKRLLAMLHMFWSNWQIAFILPALLFFLPADRIGFWVVMFGASWFATAGSAYRHYYILVMPFWSVLVALGVVQLCRLGAQRLHWPETTLRWSGIGVTVLLLCIPSLASLFPDKTGLDTKTFNPINPFPESLIVAHRIEALSTPDDYVLVAGSEPQILCLSHRLSPTRFVIAYPLMIPSPLAEKFQREAIHDIEHRPPALIVQARSNTSWLRQASSPKLYTQFLERLIAQKYERIGGYLLGERSGKWVEPISDRDIYQCSLVLYRQRN